MVTHNFTLTNLEFEFPNRVLNYTVEMDEKSSFYTRKIIKGVAKNSYAINAAKLANLPEEVIRQAKLYVGIV